MDEINEAVDKMFDQRPRSSTERQNAIQTVETCWEWDATFHILRLAVSASPHFSDSEFTETLVKYLTGMIRSAVHVRQSTLGTLCLCVLCAIDGEFIKRGRSGNNQITDAPQKGGLFRGSYPL